MPTIPSAGTANSVSLLLRQLKWWRIVKKRSRRTIKLFNPDVIYIPTADWLLKAIELLGSPFGNTPFVALYMSPAHHRKEMGLGPNSRQDWIYDRLFRRLLSITTLKSILAIDPYFVEFCGKKYRKGGKKVAFVPDFGEVAKGVSREEARREIGVYENEIAVLVYGSLTLRKGIFELLRGLADSKKSSNIRVILAGRQSEEVSQLLKSKEFLSLRDKNLIQRPFFHNDEDEALVFAASDWVWLGYRPPFYGSSGVLHQAASLGLPVIGGNQGLIRKLVVDSGLGLTTNPSSREEVAKLLDLIGGKSLPQQNRSEDFKEWTRKHSVSCHTGLVIQALQQAF